MSEPKPSGMVSLPWGLAAMAVTLVATVPLAVVACFVWEALRKAGVVAILTGHLPPWGEPQLPQELEPAVGLLSVCGPCAGAGMLVGRRARWRTAAACGALSAALFTSVAMLSDPSAAGVEQALAFGFMSSVAGAVSAVLCAVRQRWEC